ncbi:vitamin K-dependent protein Z [Ctenodactylus gundi]
MAGYVLLWGLVLFLILHKAEMSVFFPAPKANEVLVRWKRAGSYVLEELFAGNLERECYEEICVLEEAREVFEDDVVTDVFWREYRGGAPCVSQPCLNNGSCHDGIRSYTCSCSPGYEGKNCALAKNQCYPDRTDGCQHFCHPGQTSYTCRCAEGHEVGQDRRSCTPHGECACGALTPGHGLTPQRSEPGLPHSPWQVKLTDSKGEDFCGGVILQDKFVLTTAKCSLLHRNISVKTSSTGSGRAPQVVRVRSAHVHMYYDAALGQNDISLLELQQPVQCPHGGLPICMPERDFAESVLIPRTQGLLSGWMRHGAHLGDTLMTLPVTYMDMEECSQALNVTVTTRMSCERGSTATGQWAEGSVVTREHGGTWFLTGILSSPPRWGQQVGIFPLIKVARHHCYERVAVRSEQPLGQRTKPEVQVTVSAGSYSEDEKGIRGTRVPSSL